jgi:DNA-binding XRE family transcriptional regulator
MNRQVITSPSGERLVVLPEAEYEALLDAAEDGSDRRAVRDFRSVMASGSEEFLPAEFANRIVDGENRIQVWREYRGMSLATLAEQAQINPEDLAEIETGVKPASAQAVKAIAAALGLSVDDLA